MNRSFTLEYWLDEGWYVGQLKEVPGVYSQGETLEELKANVRDVYHLLLEDKAFGPEDKSEVQEIGVEV